MALYFKYIFLQSLKEVPLYVVSFYESCNNVGKQGQMDLQFRYWDSEKGRVDVLYWISSFMGSLQWLMCLNILIFVSKVLLGPE